MVWLFQPLLFVLLRLQLLPQQPVVLLLVLLRQLQWWQLFLTRCKSLCHFGRYHTLMWPWLHLHRQRTLVCTWLHLHRHRHGRLKWWLG